MADTDSSDASAPLDTVLTVVSPENIAFQFRLAGPAMRAVALAIDAVVIACLGLGAILTIGAFRTLGDAAMGPFLVAAFFVWWGYGAACEVFANGRTAGKSALGLRVVSQTGLSINPAQAILRNLLRAVDVAPPFFPGVASMALTSRLQRLGDLAAGTIVIVERPRRLPKAPRVEAGAIDIVPPDFKPDPRLLEALAAYVSRRPDLTLSRRLELSRIAAERLCRAWGRPVPPDTDGLVCGLYERAIASDAEASP